VHLWEALAARSFLSQVTIGEVASQPPTFSHMLFKG
jgi:hypothetical protein